MDSHNAQVSPEDLLTALSNVHRRRLLNSLIAESPNEGANPGLVVDDDIAMHHNHLPKLADYRLINWDRKTNRVTKGPNFETAEAMLGLLANNDGILPPTEVEV